MTTKSSYKEAIEKLERVYSMRTNKIYAKWMLANEKQPKSETLDAFAQRLMVLINDCDFAIVTTVEYKKDSVLQSFVLRLDEP